MARQLETSRCEVTHRGSVGEFYVKVLVHTLYVGLLKSLDKYGVLKALAAIVVEALLWE